MSTSRYAGVVISVCTPSSAEIGSSTARSRSGSGAAHTALSRAPAGALGSMGGTSM
ncbi:hypothetical protein [Microbacterium sp.]|uniref:hypothetical protein n=1 Tax=Microbacterium sp. TaxID=51671 RepID=UPI0026157532|nr:hypothetical protein [Microbacterium sp.]